MTAIMNDSAPFGTFAPKGFVRWVVDKTRALDGSWISWRMIFLLRRMALKVLDGAPVDIEALGARMRLLPYNNICEKKVLFTPQLFDPRELEILKSRLRDGFTFVDVGANIGVYTLFVATHAGPRARILAVEPQPEVFDRLAFNIGLNPFGTVKALDCAVADKAGDLNLFLSTDNRGESSVRIIGSGQARSVRVPARPLLDLVQEEGFTHLDGVKLDVEGAEDIILEPFLRDAPEHLYPTLLIIEDGSSRWQIDLEDLLCRKGYRLVERTRLNLIFEREPARAPA